MNNIIEYSNEYDEKLLPLLKGFADEALSSVLDITDNFLSNIDAYIHERGGKVYLLLENEKVIGFHQGHKMEDGGTYLSSGVYIKPEKRKKGYATKMKKHQESIAIQMGCKDIRSTVRSISDHGKELAESLGYTCEFSIVNMRYNIYKALQ